MAKYNLLLPRMGESVSEATIVKWIKKIGDSIEIDDTIIEIATDKVDSDVPSPVSGVLVEQLFKEDEVAQVGDVIAVIEVKGEDERVDIGINTTTGGTFTQNKQDSGQDETIEVDPIPGINLVEQEIINQAPVSHEERFFSPLVKSIAQEEGISFSELSTIKGSGLEGRITKQDIMRYVVAQKEGNTVDAKLVNNKSLASISTTIAATKPTTKVENESTFTDSGDEILEMDRMRKLISEHMTSSVQTSAHVTSFLEADVTNIVNWRNKNKEIFHNREGTKITFTPIFVEAVVNAIRDFPMINISVNGTQIIKKKNINIGMAAALPSGNLIVPVIKNADQLNLVGISKAVNDLANRSRNNKLKPDEVQGGTFTITNIGSFGNLMGTPIINQPQVAILAVGAIVKKPAVIETEYGDVIAIRHKMYLSLSYDHRVVDGALGGMFIRRVADYLEAWDVDRMS